MNKTKISKWKPHFKIETSIHLDTLIDNRNGLIIKIVTDDNIYYEIEFSNYLGYRNFNESERLSLLEEYPILTEPKSFFFIGENTNFVKWLVEESLNILDSNDMNHFFIVTSDNIIEILCNETPTFKHIK